MCSLWAYTLVSLSIYSRTFILGPQKLEYFLITNPWTFLKLDFYLQHFLHYFEWIARGTFIIQHFLPYFEWISQTTNFCFLKGHAWAQKGFRCFDPSSRSRRPSFLPSMSTSSAIPPDFRPIGSASSGSSSPVVFPTPPVRGVRVRRVATLYWAASTCTSLF